MKKILSIIASVLLLGNIQQVKAQDMGVSALVAPSSPMCAVSNQTVTVTITNYDAVNPIDFSVYNCPVMVSISGPIPQSFTATISTGTLAASGTQDVVITTSADFSTAGSYTIDANTSVAGDVNSSNDAMSSVFITVNPLPTVTILGSPSGTITVCSGTTGTLTGGGASTYTWSPGNVNTSSISGALTTPVTFTLVGTDANGCINTATEQININALPTLTVSPFISNICIGSTATLTASGANTYTWSTTDINPFIIQSPTLTTNYTVTGTGSNGCKNKATTTIFVNSLPVVTASANIAAICMGNSDTLTGSGASTYTWSSNAGSATTGSVSITPSASDTYTVTGTDGNGCINSNTVSVNVNNLPVVTATINTATVCLGSLDTLNSSGANTYTWSSNAGSATTASTSITPSASDTYTVIGTDGNGCINSNTVSVTVNNLPVVTATINTATVCSGTLDTLNSSGANSYTWSSNAGSATTASTSITPSASDTYTVIGTDGNGCINSNTVSVTVNNLPTIMATITTATLCMATLDTLNASGAVTYTWSSNAGSATTTSVSITPSASDTYTVTGTDDNGCIGTDITSITVASNFTVTAVASQTAVCAGDSTTLSGMGASSYTWASSGGTIDGGTGATVTVTPSGASTTYTVSGSTGMCMATPYTLTVNVNGLPSVMVQASSFILCAGTPDTLRAVVTGGLTPMSYTWHPGGTTVNKDTTIITPSFTATTSVKKWFVVVTDANGCTAINDTVDVQVNSLPQMMTHASSLAICAGTPDTLIGIPIGGGLAPLSYTWHLGGTAVHNDTTIITPSFTATTSIKKWFMTVQDANGCVFTNDTVDVQINALPTITINSGTICMGGSFTITPSGANTYTYSSGNAVITPTANTTYTVSGTSVAGCISDSVGMITVNSLPTLIIAAASATVCIGGMDTLTASGASTYTWSTTETTSSITTSSLAATTQYTVTGTDANNCMNSDTLSVIVNTTCTSGIELYKGNSHLALYPNPAANNITISSSAELGYVIVYNAIGQSVLETSSNQTSLQLDITKLTSGVYSVLVQGKYTKLVKQ